MPGPSSPALARIELAGLTCLCQPDLEPELRALYAAHERVYDALRVRPDSEVLRGRRPVVAGLLAGRPVVVKRLHHGGLLAGISGDRFVGSTRAERAVEAAEAVQRAGIRTAAVAFASWRRRRGFVRIELGFERLVGGTDASDAIFPRPGVVAEEWRALAARVGSLVARLHAAGVLHGDLNLMNVYLTGEGGEAILDLDKAELLPTLSDAQRRRNLARLERSVRKQGRGSSPAEVEAIVAELTRAYEAHA